VRHNPWNPKPDLMALRRAANANLVRIADGGAKREAEAKAASNKAERAANEALRKLDREEKAQLRVEVKAINQELAGLEPYWRQLADKHNKGVITPEEYGAYEEADHRRDSLYERLDPLLRRQHTLRYGR
jgi:hypothetical protein